MSKLYTYIPYLVKYQETRSFPFKQIELSILNVVSLKTTSQNTVRYCIYLVQQTTDLFSITIYLNSVTYSRTYS